MDRYVLSIYEGQVSKLDSQPRHALVAPGFLGFLSKRVDEGVTTAYFGWAAWEIARMAVARKTPEAFRLFGVMWKRHVR